MAAKSYGGGLAWAFAALVGIAAWSDGGAWQVQAQSPPLRIGVRVTVCANAIVYAGSVLGDEAIRTPAARGTGGTQGASRCRDRTANDTVCRDAVGCWKRRVRLSL